MTVPKATELPPFIVHENDVPEVEGHYRPPFEKEAFSWTRDLGRAAGTVNVGLGVDRLPPGRRTGFTHAHSEEEEMVYVLKGTCAVRIIEPGRPPVEYELRAGHMVAFPAGTAVAHTFVNHGDSDCFLLVVGERKEATDRVFFPEDTGYDEATAQERPWRHWKRT
ncbi:cupin domain-containing protein [Pendulispora albinea]|uniref:Cupin domain-containing protein n=1 Tax=Pendulispora albinea TaxID=2741071 RepID=A0ABZ2MA70_9BACT